MWEKSQHKEIKMFNFLQINSQIFYCIKIGSSITNHQMLVVFIKLKLQVSMHEPKHFRTPKAYNMSTNQLMDFSLCLLCRLERHQCFHS